MELTKEYFDEKLSGLATKKDLEGFATKKDLEGLAAKKDLEGLATKVDLKESFEELARMTAEGFQSTATKEEVETLRKEIKDTRTEMGENFASVRTTIGKVFDRVDASAAKQEIFDGELNRLRVRAKNG